MSAGFKPVTKDHPCPACGRPDWCAWTERGLLKCERTTDPPRGFRVVKPSAGGAYFAPIDAGSNGRASASGVRSAWGHPGGSGGRSASSSDGCAASTPGSPAGLDWEAESRRFEGAIDAARLDALAAQLGVRPDSLRSLGCGWASRSDLQHLRASGAGWPENYPDGAYTFPERDGAGRAVGLSLRAADGRKGAPSRIVGSRRGLIVPRTLRDESGVVLIVEGATDVAAASCLGLTAVGRPSAAGGADDLARLLKRCAVLVVGENDAKNSGAWPGRDAAERIAQRLATEWDEPVAWSLPPQGAKDVRAYLNARVTAGLVLDDAEACRAAAQELLEHLRSEAEEAEPQPSPTQAERIVRLALEMFRIGLAEGDEPFAVPLDGPNIALMLRGSRDALRATLAREYRRRYGSAPSASALADALATLHGEALECAPEPLHLRLARHERSIVLDLGRADGAVVVIDAAGWSITEHSPVIFRRTALTGELPIPEPDGELSLLRGLLNLSDRTWDLLRGTLVASLIPDIPHPVVLWTGEQGTGKTTGAALTVGLFDPSPAEVRSPPRDPEQWAIAAAGSWGVVVDNISWIPDWLSDALCKACTGDGWLRRRLYTDGDITVLAFRRVLMLTSIDTGALRGDLGDRLVILDLQRIADDQRVPDAALRQRYRELRPRILGGLLDLLVDVLRVLERLEPVVLPRMADYALVLMAVDRVLGSSALSTYINQRDRIANEVVDDDAVGSAIVRFMDQRARWSGSMKDLCGLITPQTPPAKWPRSPRALGGMLRRLAPALARLGIEVIPPDPADKSRRFVLRSIARTARPPENGSPTPPSGSGAGSDGASGRAVDPDIPADRPGDSPAGIAPSGRSGPSGDPGDELPPFSGPERTSSCRACGRATWWRTAGETGGWTCGACHPPAPGLDAEWAGPEGGAP